MIGGEWISRRSYTKDSFKDLKKSDDLISRQAAIKALEDAGMTNYLATGEFYGIINALTVIKNMPTAEPRKGRDVSGEVAYYCDFKCSLCGADIGIVEGGVMDGGEFNYCPNCGARMTEA